MATLTGSIWKVCRDSIAVSTFAKRISQNNSRQKYHEMCGMHI